MDPTISNMTWNRPGCRREAAAGLLVCLPCRQSNSAAVRKRRLKNGELGLCDCGQSKLIGYHLCHRCKIKEILRQRRVRNVVVLGDLYIFRTPRGLKIGRSGRLDERKKDVSRRYFDGANLQIVAIYEGMGYPFRAYHSQRLPRSPTSGGVYLRRYVRQDGR